MALDVLLAPEWLAASLFLGGALAFFSWFINSFREKASRRFYLGVAVCLVMAVFYIATTLNQAETTRADGVTVLYSRPIATGLALTGLSVLVCKSHQISSGQTLSVAVLMTAVTSTATFAYISTENRQWLWFGVTLGLYGLALTIISLYGKRIDTFGVMSKAGLVLTGVFYMIMYILGHAQQVKCTYLAETWAYAVIDPVLLVGMCFFIYMTEDYRGRIDSPSKEDSDSGEDEEEGVTPDQPRPNAAQFRLGRSAAAAMSTTGSANSGYAPVSSEMVNLKF